MSAPAKTPPPRATPPGAAWHGSPAGPATHDARLATAPRRVRVTRMFVGLALVFVVLLVVGILPRLARQRDLRAEAKERTGPVTVRVMLVRQSGAASEAVLPGTAQAMRETPVYARTSGYVRRWLVDIGSRVGSGQLLAELETPEVDQEVAQARSTLARARAAETLARASLERLRSLVRDSAATPQELDEKQAAFDAAQATVGAEDANVRRLSETQRFARVTAPFAGVITARNLEQGGLVTAGTAGAAARPLFVIAQSDTIRVFVNVPENVATSIIAGQQASVTVNDNPGRELRGRVTRTSGAIDPSTRTLLAQVEVPNVGNALIPGMFAQVKLATRHAAPAMLIPANALVVRADGPQVAVVRGGKIHFARITLARDLGTEVEVTSGVSPGDQVVINPSDAVVEGTPVRTVDGSSDAGGARDRPATPSGAAPKR